MRKSRAILLAGLAAVAVSGAALASGSDSHRMNVQLPDGSVAHIVYQGNIAPEVTIDLAEPLRAGFGLPVTGAPFGMLDRMITAMDRQADAIARGIPAVAGPAGASVASYDNLPAGSSSYTMISTSNGRTSCTRTTQVVADAPGKPPRVSSSLSGDCSAVAQPPARFSPPKASVRMPNNMPLDRT